MAETPLYLYEFLWRGRPPGGDGGGTYHVILAQETKDAFGTASTATSGALTPDQAKAQGFDLKTVLADVNTDALADADRLKKQVGELSGKIVELQAKLVAAPATDASSPGLRP